MDESTRAPQPTYLGMIKVTQRNLREGVEEGAMYLRCKRGHTCPCEPDGDSIWCEKCGGHYKVVNDAW